MADPDGNPQLVKAFGVAICPNEENGMAEAWLTFRGDPERVLLASIRMALLDFEPALYERFKALVRDFGTVLALEMTGAPPAAVTEGAGKPPWEAPDATPP